MQHFIFMNKILVYIYFESALLYVRNRAEGLSLNIPCSLLKNIKHLKSFEKYLSCFIIPVYRKQKIVLCQTQTV